MRNRSPRVLALLLTLLALLSLTASLEARDWTQLKGDARRSGDAPHETLALPLRLHASAALTDAGLSSPIVAAGRVFVLDAAGVLSAFDATTLASLWRFRSPAATGEAARHSPSGTSNATNVASPAVAGSYVHFGTVAGDWFVLEASTGRRVTRIPLGEPVFSAPLVTAKGVYLATLGGRVFALGAAGDLRWTWDFVREVLEFPGDRWDGADWARRVGRATWKHQFLVSRDIAAMTGADGVDTLVVPAGGTVVWLRDDADGPQVRALYRGSRESPGTLGLSIGEDGTVYRQWHRRDNNGSVEMLRVVEKDGAETIEVGTVRGTETSYQGEGQLSFSTPSLRGRDVYRVRPEEGLGLCRHREGAPVVPLAEAGALAAPILTREHAVFGGLDGTLRVVALDGSATEEFPTAFGAAISAPAAVVDGRVYFACEDGYLYSLASSGASRSAVEGEARLPSRSLALHEIRRPLSSSLRDPRHDWFTHFGNFANTNSTDQDLEPPFRTHWIRRLEGTVKHHSVCGGGRVYTHTAEGQILAVEQETGRLLWRRYFPGVHVSFTAAVYHEGRLLVPQAGLESCRLRCLDAATGAVLWEAPFSGSPSWNRQLPPIIHDGLVFYLFSSGHYDAKGWLFEHQSTFGFAKDQRPLVAAWDLETGASRWQIDFAEHGAGGDDAGMCLLDGRLYYSCYFGGDGAQGVTAAIEPATGEVLWTTTEHSVHAGCTVSGKDGRIYLGGYNPVEEKLNRVWCLDAKDGALVWASEPLSRAIHVVTIAERFLFTHSQYQHAYLLDTARGTIQGTLLKGYNCTRFTIAEPYILGANMDVYDTSDGVKLVSSGPAVDVLQCVGAIASNGRLYYTANSGGVQLGMLTGAEAR